jgi:hypothetical protein
MQQTGACLVTLSPPYFDSILQVWHGQVERDEANSIFCSVAGKAVSEQRMQLGPSTVQGECQLRF